MVVEGEEAVSSSVVGSCAPREHTQDPISAKIPHRQKQTAARTSGFLEISETDPNDEHGRGLLLYRFLPSVLHPRPLSEHPSLTEVPTEGTD